MYRGTCRIGSVNPYLKQIRFYKFLVSINQGYQLLFKYLSISIIVLLMQNPYYDPENITSVSFSVDSSYFPYLCDADPKVSPVY